MNTLNLISLVVAIIALVCSGFCMYKLISNFKSNSSSESPEES